MQVFFFIAYLVVGTVQLFAIAAGVDHGLHVGGAFSFGIALFTTYIPLLGSLLGVYGATTEWGWGLLQAGLLFFWYVPVTLVLVFIGMVSSGFQR
jgi:hypothetical protein